MEAKLFICGDCVALDGDTKVMINHTLPSAILEMYTESKVFKHTVDLAIRLGHVDLIDKAAQDRDSVAKGLEYLKSVINHKFGENMGKQHMDAIDSEILEEIDEDCINESFNED